MTDVKAQRICIKFCLELGKIAEETYKILKKTSGDNVQGQMQPYEWFK